MTESIKNVNVKCKSCETVIELKDAYMCESCIYENEEDTESVETSQYFYCLKCTEICDACKERGCKKCVTFACCDCGYDMCNICRNNDSIDCGCYGECYRCYININRGSEGWPCSECEMWYCDHCRPYDNPCKECGPTSDSELDSDSDNEEN